MLLCELISPTCSFVFFIYRALCDYFTLEYFGWLQLRDLKSMMGKGPGKGGGKSAGKAGGLNHVRFLCFSELAW